MGKHVRRCAVVIESIVHVRIENIIPCRSSYFRRILVNHQDNTTTHARGVSTNVVQVASVYSSKKLIYSHWVHLPSIILGNVASADCVYVLSPVICKCTPWTVIWCSQAAVGHDCNPVSQTLPHTSSHCFVFCVSDKQGQVHNGSMTGIVPITWYRHGISNELNQWKHSILYIHNSCQTHVNKWTNEHVKRYKWGGGVL